MKTDYFPKGRGPTSVEVDLVEKGFLDIVARQDETLLPHPEIAAVAGVTYGTRQYGRVVRRWIARMREEHNIVIVCEVGKGYMATTDPGKIDAALQEQRAGIRKFRKSGKILNATDRAALAEPQQRAYDQLSVQAADILRRARQITRTVTAELHATPALPAARVPS